MTGQWALHYLNHLASLTGVAIPVVVATRDPQSARAIRLKLLQHLSLDVVHIDLMEISLRRLVPSHIWHFSADTSSGRSRNYASIRSADYGMARQLLDIINSLGISPHIVYTSSGAVYGRNRLSSTPASEHDSLVSDSLLELDPYDRVKIEVENLLLGYSSTTDATVGICRLFAFVGPLIPTDAHFAIGNFIGSAVRQEPIVLKSAGQDFRSWLYCGDLARYLIGLSLRPDSFVVNIGSREYMTIRDAAILVADIAKVQVLEQAPSDAQRAPTYYLPDVSQLDQLVKLDSLLSLWDAALATIKWLRNQI